MTRLLRAAAALALLSGASSPALAAVTLLNETFDAENGGRGALDFAGLTQFEVIGSIDLIRSGDYGIACAGGAGGCIDLDGSRSGRIRTRSSYTVRAGDTVLLSFDLAGNGRIPTGDPFQAGFEFDAPFSATAVQATGPAGSDYNSGIGNFAGTRLFQSIGSLPTGAPMAGYTLRFTAAQAGTFRTYLGTASNDAYGPILDNVRMTVDPAAVPEPATWASLALGFGVAGTALRRRRRFVPA